MKRILRRRPAPATVIACIALFASLGGVSYGVATGFIDSREIKDDDIRSRDIRNNTLRTRDLRNNDVRGIDIRNSTIRGRDVALDTLTGKDIKESKLEKVPAAASADSATNAARAADAAKLGGNAPSAFAPADAEAVRLVGAADQPPFESGEAAGGGDLAPGFWKDPFGTVHLQGTVSDAGGTIFTLPVGYRPAGTASFAVAVDSTPPSTGVVTVEADGTVKAPVSPPSVALDGITFRAAG